MTDISNRIIFLYSYDVYYKCCFIIKNDSENLIKSNSIYFFEMGHFYIYDLTYHNISISRPSPTVSQDNYFQCWVKF